MPRPKLYPNKRHVVGVRLDDEHFKQWQAKTEALGVPQQDVLVQLIKSWIKDAPMRKAKKDEVSWLQVMLQRVEASQDLDLISLVSAPLERAHAILQERAHRRAQESSEYKAEEE